MACARIPKTNCTVNSLLTASRENDLSSLVTIYKQIEENVACRQPSRAVMQTVLTQGTIGLPAGSTVSLSNANVYTQSVAAGGSEGSTSSFTGNSILAPKAYPKSSALLSISSTFNTAHPMNSGTTAYDTTTWYGGSNLNVASVTSCETLGLGYVGPTPIQSSDSISTINSKKNLTDVKEIVYAFSSYNLAASAYSRAITTVSAATATVDAVACNRQFRKATVIPSTLGVGTTLPVIDATSGDGGATSLITACVYGADSTTRDTVSTLLSTTLSGLAACPAAAASGATSFGATGLNTYTGFPNGQ